MIGRRTSFKNVRCFSALLFPDFEAHTTTFVGTTKFFSTLLPNSFSFSWRMRTNWCNIRPLADVIGWTVKECIILFFFLIAISVVLSLVKERVFGEHILVEMNSDHFSKLKICDFRSNHEHLKYTYKSCYANTPECQVKVLHTFQSTNSFVWRSTNDKLVISSRWYSMFFLELFDKWIACFDIIPI